MTHSPIRQDRRRLVAAGLGGAALGSVLAPQASAQAAWPSKVITMVVGYPPGGQTDFAGRAVSASLQATLGQNVVIDNRAGANGNIATDNVAKAPPDGYRLLVGNLGNMTLNPHTFRNSPVQDPRKLVPIGTLLQSSLMLVVPTSLPVKDIKEFIALVKSKDSAGGVDFASSGPGSVTQAIMELFREQIGKPKINHVPYKGSAPAIVDLIAGRVSGLFDACSVVAPYLKSGQLKALMVTGDKRVPAFADIPTAREAGLKEFQITSYIGLYGPPGLPADIVKKANDAINVAMKDPTVQKNIVDRGDELGGGSADDLGKTTSRYYDLWAQVVKANDIRAE